MIDISPDLNVKPEYGNICRRDIQLDSVQQSDWLMDAAVQYKIHNHKSQWHLNMIYAWTKTPYRILRRRIDAYSTEKKAITYASILQRGIRKDSRGTLTINSDDLHICTN